MTSTHKLYLDSLEAAYDVSFDAQVVDVSEHSIILDRTLFYPIGGGQNWDTGTLVGPNGPVEVVEVRGREAIEHHVGGDHQLEVGDEIRGTIDWQRRHAHMRMLRQQCALCISDKQLRHGGRPRFTCHRNEPRKPRRVLRARACEARHSHPRSGQGRHNSGMFAFRTFAFSFLRAHASSPHVP